MVSMATSKIGERPIAQKSLKILIVSEWDSRMGGCLNRFLNSEGYGNVFLVEEGNSEEGLKLIKTKKIDLLITEEHLSGAEIKSGAELCGKAKIINPNIITFLVDFSFMKNGAFKSDDPESVKKELGEERGIKVDYVIGIREVMSKNLGERIVKIIEKIERERKFKLME